MRVCIVGLGFVGDAMYKSFILKGLKENVNLFAYDKYKNNGIGKIENILKCDIAFLALPTKYDNLLCKYDKSAIIECCDYLSENNYKGVIVIKSTVEPETTEFLSDQYINLDFIHNPEFLTARTAFKDFHNQKHIVLGKAKKCPDYKLKNVYDLYNKLYPDAKINNCLSIESESMKIFCNTFYAVKVQFFTELYMLTKANGSNYNKIVELMLANDWINPMHTQVPGPDGNISYGGLCFPKDTNALSKYMEYYETPNNVLNATIEERNTMRSDNDNIVKNKIILEFENAVNNINILNKIL